MTRKMQLSLGADHAGFELKEYIKTYLINSGWEVKDFGTYSEESTDYPEYAHAVAEAVQKGDSEIGIIMCGSGNGINMAANKHQGIRSALCWNKEVSQLARAHNNANILALPARCISQEEALDIVNAFLETEFEGGRHERRVNKIPCADVNC